MRIRRALDQPVQIQCIDTPLSKIVGRLQDDAEIPIVVDHRALDDVGLGSDTPITVSLVGQTLRGTLRHMLKELDLTYVVHDEVLKITTPEEAENELSTRVYDVASFGVDDPMVVVDPMAPSTRLDKLIDVIEATIAPDTWSSVGGAGEIQPMDLLGTITVSQVDEVHDQISGLLSAIAQARATPAAGHELRTAVPIHSTRTEEIRIRIDSILAKDAALEFMDASLEELAEYLREEHQLPVLIDNRALDDVGLGSDTPVTVDLRGISLGAALRLTLKNLDLTWVVNNEVLKITTPEEAERELLTCVYPVHDLVGSQPVFGAHRAYWDPIVTTRSLRQLVAQLTSCAAPRSWDQVGGAGAIEPVVPWGVLVISQTADVHRQVAAQLKVCRKVASRQPASEQVQTQQPEVLELHYYEVVEPVEEVIKTIKGTIEPNSWVEGDSGPQIYSVGNKLMIRQTPSVHVKIYQLFTRGQLQVRGLGRG